ncbi:hypothetical protein [Bacillus cereus]|uniref:hypothetical protein n=1 Tax=Bacillus cereus TaxID=1396 RepID=UPI000BFD3E73|nr:hypothetical protein [Bacillus cereus]PGV71978.1 hypothetical protein COD84_24210 [Bacillus cereus]
MSNKYKIFFIMPFDTEFNDLYAHIKEIIENEDERFEVFRADNLLNQQNILKDIVISINNSDLIVADLTDLNPNVFYELGIAHALRKNVILLTQQIDELPFDLRSYRVLSYSTNFKKILELDSSLKRMLNEIKNGQMSFGSPITDWIPEEIKSVNNIFNSGSNANSISNVLESSQTSTFEYDMEERGLLDYMADLDDSMIDLTHIMGLFSSKTEDLGEQITKKALEIEKAFQNKGQGTTSQVRKLTRKTSSIMNEYGLSIAKYNKDYDRSWTSFEENINNLFNSEFIKKEVTNDVDSFQGFVNSLGNFKDYIYPTRSALETMNAQMQALKGVEASMTRAVLLVEQEIKEFMDLLDKSVATTERLHIKGIDLIKKYYKSSVL